MKWWQGNPYLPFGRRPFREARLRAYIVRQHRVGRPLLDILADPYVARCGSESFRWQVLEDPQTLEALGENDLRALQRLSSELGHGHS